METDLVVGIVISGVFLLFVVLSLMKGIRVVAQSEVMLIERLGNFNRTINSGLHFIIPYLEEPREVNWQRDGQRGGFNRIDMREIVLDIPEQTTITKDNVSLRIDAVLYVQIIDPRKAAYEVANLPVAVGQLAQTTLRSVVGEIELDETLASRDKINTKLKNVLDEVTDKWGLNVNRVELANVQPPPEVLNAMEKQMQAERERRAVVLEAEGERQARIARSMGEREEKINRAQGEKEALIQNAQGEKEALIQNAAGEAHAIRETIQAEKEAIEAMIGAFDGNAELAARYLIAKGYIQAYRDFTHGEGDKVYLPFDASSAMASFGNLGDLFKAGKGE